MLGSRLSICRGVRRLVFREASSLRLPRVVSVRRRSRVYTTQAEFLALQSAGLGTKSCQPTHMLSGRSYGELIFTRRPHFYIDKKKKIK